MFEIWLIYDHSFRVHLPSESSKPANQSEIAYSFSFLRKFSLTSICWHFLSSLWLTNCSIFIPHFMRNLEINPLFMGLHLFNPFLISFLFSIGFILSTSISCGTILCMYYPCNSVFLAINLEFLISQVNNTSKFKILLSLRKALFDSLINIVLAMVHYFFNYEFHYSPEVNRF